MVKLIFMLLFITNSFASEEFRERIVLIDTGIDSMSSIGLCRDGHRDFTETGMTDMMNHGEIIYRIASQNVDFSKFCFTIIKWTNSQTYTGGSSRIINIMKYVSSLKPQYVNISSDGSMNTLQEEYIIKKMSQEGTRFFISAGNDGKNLKYSCDVYPPCYNIPNNFYVVSAKDGNGQRLETSNYGGPAKYIRLGVYTFSGKLYRGTSFASPTLLNEELTK